MKTSSLKKDIIAAIMAFIRVGVFTITEAFTIGLGHLWSIVFAVFYALQIVLVGKYGKGNDVNALCFFQFIASGSLALLVAVAMVADYKIKTATGLWQIGHLIIFYTAVVLFIQFHDPKYVRHLHATLIMSLCHWSPFLVFFSLWFLETILIHE